MIVFLHEFDGSISEHLYENENGFVREVTLIDRNSGVEMRGRMFFESETIEFVCNETLMSYVIAAIIPEGH